MGAYINFDLVNTAELCGINIKRSTLTNDEVEARCADETQKGRHPNTGEWIFLILRCIFIICIFHNILHIATENFAKDLYCMRTDAFVSF